MHGDERGSVDRNHNSFGARLAEANPLREAYEHRRMLRDAETLDPPARATVLAAIQDACRHAGWQLYAAHVRGTHVHVVVKAEPPPEQVIGKFKARSSRALNSQHRWIPKRWSRHGSTRRLWSPREVDSAVEYVIRRQGEPMAVYEKPNRWSSLAIPPSRTDRTDEPTTTNPDKNTD